MDTSDPGIEFDADGVCNRCSDYEVRRAAYTPTLELRETLLQREVDRIRDEGRGKDYDCVIGVSGGVDSTYTAYLVKQMGLRPLAVHLDNGWNSELAVANIEKCLKTLGIDLYTMVLDWDEFRELQLAFLKASTPDSEVPSDHAIVSCIKWKAHELGVRNFILGTNVATEGIYAPMWSYGHTDWKYINSLNRLFGTRPLKTFPHCTLAQNMYLRYVCRQKNFSILNYVDYHKEEALRILERTLGYVRYAGKHHESVYTRFYQSYILPVKFGFDKRRPHFSGLIMAGQITRQHALEEMHKPPMDPAHVREDKVFVAKKLGLTETEFDAIMALPCKAFTDYPSYEKTWLVSLRRVFVRRKLAWLASRGAEQESRGRQEAVAAPVLPSAPTPEP